MSDKITMRDAKKLYRAEKKQALEQGVAPPTSLRRLARAHYGRRNTSAIGKLVKVLAA